MRPHGRVGIELLDERIEHYQAGADPVAQDQRDAGSPPDCERGSAGRATARS